LGAERRKKKRRKPVEETGESPRRNKRSWEREGRKDLYFIVKGLVG
jgi:hypothetical protein